jgi:hypothetical protein
MSRTNKPNTHEIETTYVGLYQVLCFVASMAGKDERTQYPIPVFSRFKFTGTYLYETVAFYGARLGSAQLQYDMFLL